MNEFSLDNAKITAAIASAEARTSGEIRVVVYPHGVDNAVEAARQEFARLAMHRTRERNAVLILVAPASRTYAVFGDRGVHEQCGEGFWQTIASVMGEHFRRGAFTEGIVAAVNETGAVLAKQYPHRPGDRNELPDDVIERGTVV